MYVSTLPRWTVRGADGAVVCCKVSLRMYAESYTPRTWRTHPLHICPPEPYSAGDPLTKECLNWIFLISSLNFSFWSERDGTPERYGVEWRAGWDTETRAVHTGYWSLVAALNRGESMRAWICAHVTLVQRSKKTSRSLIRHFTRPRCSVLMHGSRTCSVLRRRRKRAFRCSRSGLRS